MDTIQADARAEWSIREEQVGNAEPWLCKTVHPVESEVRVAVLDSLRLHVRVHLCHSRVDRVDVARRQDIVGGSGYVGTGRRRWRLGQQREHVSGNEEIIRAEITVETHADAEGEER